MVSGRYLRYFVGGLLALVWLLSFQVGTIVAARSGCDVHVSPRSGPAGSEFVFIGSGFQPSELSLKAKAHSPVDHNINVSGDGWQYKVRSRTADEGVWVAAFTDAQANCTAKAEFRVTPATTGASTGSSTGSSSGASSSASPTAAVGPKLPVINLWLAVAVIGLVGGTAVGLRAFARNQA